MFGELLLCRVKVRAVLEAIVEVVRRGKYTGGFGEGELDVLSTTATAQDEVTRSLIGAQVQLCSS